MGVASEMWNRMSLVWYREKWQPGLWIGYAGAGNREQGRVHLQGREERILVKTEEVEVHWMELGVRFVHPQTGGEVWVEGFKWDENYRRVLVVARTSEGEKKQFVYDIISTWKLL